MSTREYITLDECLGCWQNVPECGEGQIIDVFDDKNFLTKKQFFMSNLPLNFRLYVAVEHFGHGAQLLAVLREECSRLGISRPYDSSVLGDEALVFDYITEILKCTKTIKDVLSEKYFEALLSYSLLRLLTTGKKIK